MVNKRHADGGGSDVLDTALIRFENNVWIHKDPQNNLIQTPKNMKN